ncbi:hypothetical protein [Arthrobacter bambusae]|uniref:hypothetical protein n=1 Tax=Arthrobacter bambusae TaxID=1338426 RepID=UPI00277D45B7|nr:hypothetical protein [Arthrobacter bambusae]MDQ0241497.1 hypothetical protein [Arthrobacter bambusae]
MPMRWLTRETFTGGLSDEEHRERDRQWLKARQSVRPLLHSGAERLIDINLHDGVINQLRQVEPDVVECQALIGDNDVGYEWLHARYLGAGLNVVEAGFGAGGSLFEILRDELAIQDGSFVHSVITWPRGEFDIVFRSVDVALTPGKGGERMALFARTYKQ